VEVLEVDGARIAFEVRGEGPAVVLIHEGIADSRMWDRELETLSGSRRVLRYDIRGYGSSTLSPGAHSHARDLLAAMSAAGVDRGALVGCSLGGRIALEVAVAEPDRVAALVLVGAGLPGWDWSAEIEAYQRQEEELFEAGKLDEAVELNVRVWVDGPERDPADVDPAVRERVRTMQRQIFDNYAQELAAGVEPSEELLVPDLRARLGEVRAPTLVVVGEVDQPDIHGIAERLHAEIPNARKAVIRAAAHIPNLERPEEFEQLVTGFLDEVGA
jgi:3-oxoadipate enol-lactonase